MRITGRISTFVLVSLLGAGALATAADAQTSQRLPLRPSDIADITTLTMLEDQRNFDSTALTRILASPHPEVRRRAALTIGRIIDPRSRELLRKARADSDTAVFATVVFSTGQLNDTSAITWLDSLLRSNVPVAAAVEAAGALGKIRTPEARTVLSSFLTASAAHLRNPTIVGEALLSIGRHAPGDIAPIVMWTVSDDVEIRWRATWALFRPRGHESMQHLVRLANDPSPMVRTWAVRGLTPALLDSAQIPRAGVVAQIARLTNDGDRTVRTEAVRALAAFPDSAAIAVAYTSLQNRDTWISVSAAEGLARHAQHAAASTQRLMQVIRPGSSSWLQVVALTSITALSPDNVVAAATAMARDTAVMVRVAAVNALRARAAQAVEVLTVLQNDPAAEVSGPARAALTALRTPPDSNNAAGARAGGGAAGGGGRRGGGAGRGGGGGGGGRAGGRGPIQTGRTEADYREIVERWIVPDYNGAPRPRAEWTTARGRFEIELYPGDAPIGVADFFRNVESGALIGVDFSRVVPDFVDQQRGIPNHPVVRDEVNRNRLTRGNLSWASAGLDTGRPGYTLGHTPQPHNEGGFTSLGRIVGGMDVVDRVELGDRIVAARILSTGR